MQFTGRVVGQDDLYVHVSVSIAHKYSRRRGGSLGCDHMTVVLRAGTKRVLVLKYMYNMYFSTTVPVVDDTSMKVMYS